MSEVAPEPDHTASASGGAGSVAALVDEALARLATTMPGEVRPLARGAAGYWRDDEIRRLELELAAMVDRNAELRAHVAALADQIAALAAEIEAMTDSRSWRVTRPLRWAADLRRRLRGGR